MPRVLELSEGGLLGLGGVELPLRALGMRVLLLLALLLLRVGVLVVLALLGRRRVLGGVRLAGVLLL